MSVVPLSVERSKATFSSEALVSLLHGSKAMLDAYLRWEHLFSDNPLFRRDKDMYLSRSEYIQTSIRRSFETFRILKENKDLLAAHSPLHGDGGLMLGEYNVSTGISDHFGLFVGTLLLQGTPAQQQEWLRPALNLKIIGTYAQTELGHGTSIRGLETTATYDAQTDEFVLHSPTVSSTKWWPGALGLLATHAVLYAKLIIGGTDHGFHAFVVPLRDAQHRPLPGVDCGDIGPKMGYAAYDSGFLRLTHVRVPRFHMLAKFQQVARGGAYTQAPKQLQKIAYFTMLRTRVIIAVGAGRALARAVTISVRYCAAVRDATSPGRVLLDNPTYCLPVVRTVSTAYVMFLATRVINTIFSDVERGLKMVGAKRDAASLAAIERSLALLPELHTLSAGLKAFCTDLSMHMMEESRRHCGGHGYAMHAGYGLFFYNCLASVTYEGDMIPMALQCARFLLKSFVSVLQRKTDTLGQSVKYLARRRRRRMTSAAIEDFLQPAVVVHEFLAEAARRAVARASYRTIRLLRAGKTFDEAWNETQALQFRAAKLHIRFFLASEALESYDASRLGTKAGGSPLLDSATIAVLDRLVCAFALQQLCSGDSAGTLHLDSHLTVAESEAAWKALAAVSDALRPDLVSLVDAFGFSDFALSSTIGNRNNQDMYHQILQSVEGNPINSPEFVRTFHQDVLSKFLNAQFVGASATIQRELTEKVGGGTIDLRAHL